MFTLIIVVDDGQAITHEFATVEKALAFVSTSVADFTLDTGKDVKTYDGIRPSMILITRK